MTIHARHPSPADREEFLVDGCPRCAEYLRDLGLPFDEQRFRQFWAKMLEVEYHDQGDYASELDKELGRSLYRVSLSLQRAFGVDPHALEALSMTPRMILVPPGGGRFAAFTTMERDELSRRLEETFTLGDNGIAERLREEIDR